MFDKDYYKKKADDQERHNAYYRKKSALLPLQVTFGGKLTHALFACFTERTLDKRSREEKLDALKEVIHSKYDNLIELFDDSGYSALKFFFGKEASIFKEIWHRSFDYSYQTGVFRKPYRTKFGTEPYLEKNLRLFSDYIHMTALEIEPVEFLKAPHLYETFSNAYYTSPALAARLSYEIDTGNNQVRQLIEMAVNENSGTICTEIIHALVQSKSSWAHELLGSLLLAAKLQEGLRQAIVEAMDEGSTQAFIYLLKLIIDNNLQRFTSVVRAFDVWTGLPVSAEKPATVAYYLKHILTCVTSENTDCFLNGENPLECYIALLCKGFYEVRDGIRALDTLLKSELAWKRAVGFYWLSQMQVPETQLDIAWGHVDEREPFVLSYMLTNLFPYKNKTMNYNKLFDDLNSIIEFLPKKKVTFSFPGMPNLQSDLSVEDVLRNMIHTAKYSKSTAHYDVLCDYTERMGADLRYDFAENFADNITTAKQRKTLLLMAGDKSPYIRNMAANALLKLSLTANEYKELEEMLRYKSQDLRKNVMVLLFNQDADGCLKTLKRLASSDDANCKLAAKQMLRDMKTDKKYTSVIEEAEKAVGSDTNEDRYNQPLQTKENGMGLFDPSALTILSKPEATTEITLKTVMPDLDKLYQSIKQMSDLVDANRDVEYETESWDGSNETVVFGTQNYLRPINRQKERSVYSLPLSELFVPMIEKLFPNHELDRAMFVLSFIHECTVYSGVTEKAEKLYNVFDLNKKLRAILDVPYYHSHIRTYLEYYYNEKSADFGFYYNIANRIFQTVSSEEMCSNLEEKGSSHTWNGYHNEYAYFDWFGAKEIVGFWVCKLGRIQANDEDFKKAFELEYAYTEALQFVTTKYLPLEHIMRAFDLKLITENDVCYYFSKPGLVDFMSQCTLQNEYTEKLLNKHPDFFPIVQKIIDHTIHVETLRGELPSPLSGLAGKIHSCFGAKHFVDIVAAMKQGNYTRGYNFASEDSTKSQTLSFLLKNLYPGETDDIGSLANLLKDKKITPKQLVDAAMYAPQWLELIEEYLNIPGLKKAGYYFHAHLNEMFDEKKQATVARYSSISSEDFKSGAFDPDWFRSAYEEVGEKNFIMLYDAAKYIAGGNLHKRSQLFSDAVLGKLEIEDMKTRASEKRNRDCLLAYTLIPIQSDQDALERYLYIEKFRKESRQFGAQRQQSESRTCTIALGNLARNAGYSDTLRFTLQMETKKLDEVSGWLKPQQLGEITLQITIDADGYASLTATLNGKTLSSIPAKYKKSEMALHGSEVVKSLREQQRRARSTFESAMVGQDSFSSSELDLLMTNPVLSPMLKNLLFICNDTIGFWGNGGLIDLDGTYFANNAGITIAHPYHLLSSGKWAKWQIHFCSNQMKQPFKQVFREYYAPSPDELSEKTVSRRYAGHQIMPRKAAALAGNRGWNTSEGLFKVFYRENILVELFSGFTLFTPADTEPPVIETIRFTDNKTGKPLEIAELPPVLFSEVMRDIDLIVSVAHFGAVDPEASLSTVEMRSALVTVLLPLLKIDNVKLEGAHAFIKGEYGEYTVHLGSGTASMMAKGMIPIVPVHSGQRGRVFLPFADDDPKTAEIISKIVLLAEDIKIKDPTILQFIRT